ncbi:MAG: hypothetical protein HC800_21565 [Phormidesmis sp. RL_2_1]|nr:hypothetical protein [Phormidesmis sp. RL_2_1]
MGNDFRLDFSGLQSWDNDGDRSDYVWQYVWQYVCAIDGLLMATMPACLGWMMWRGSQAKLSAEKAKAQRMAKRRRDMTDME